MFIFVVTQASVTKLFTLKDLVSDVPMAQRGTNLTYLQVLMIGLVKWPF